MVKINRIYTRTGDDGSTGLVGGTRIGKDSDRVNAYGDLDEFNAFLGMARTLAEKSARQEILTKLEIIQNEVFDIGAELASPYGADLSNLPTVKKEQAARLEGWIDELTCNLDELTSFVLPGGTELNGMLHITRAVCRRCERAVIRLHQSEPISDSVRIYLNRLSDLLFAMARFESDSARVPEYLWKPGAGSPRK